MSTEKKDLMMEEMDSFWEIKTQYPRIRTCDNTYVELEESNRIMSYDVSNGEYVVGLLENVSELGFVEILRGIEDTYNVFETFGEVKEFFERQLKEIAL